LLLILIITLLIHFGNFMALKRFSIKCSLKSFACEYYLEDAL
jgi:hypothetical protein